jgi:hypothetical protein
MRESIATLPKKQEAKERGKKEEKRMFKRIILSLLGMLCVCALLSAQIPTGKIYGTVTDEEGNTLPGVTVEATSPKLIGMAATTTDVNGIYRLFNLTPGEYKITFTLQGFKPFIRENIIVHVEETLRVDIQMQIGAIEEEITVIGESPIIDVKSTTKGMTLTKDMFLILPRGRNFDTLVSAVPGVNQEPWLGGLSVDGASGAENMFYMDGTDITTVERGERGQSAAFELVDEVKVVASGYPAEFGGALGGVVSVVTRQGGNEFTGEIIGYYEGSALNGKERDTLRLNPFDVYVAEYVNYQDMYGKDKRDRIEAGFNLSGYILKDRLWFFATALPVYTPIVRNVTYLTTPPIEGRNEQENWAFNYQAKITAQPFNFMRMGASFVNNFTKYRGNLPSRDGSGNPDDIYEKYGFDYPNFTIQGFADFTFGNNFMINVRGGRFYENTTNQQVVAADPRRLLTGDGTQAFDGTVLEIPAAYQKARGWQNHGRIYTTDRYIAYKNHASADFTYYLNFSGEHAFRAGVSWVRQGEDVFSALPYPDKPDIYFYWNRDLVVGGVNYGRGTYGYYEVRGNAASGPFGSVYDVHNDRWALYIQDSWTIANKLTVNFGVRAESEYVPPYSEDPSIPSDFRPLEFDFGDKLAPRIGFTYDMFGDATLKIFGTYGLYYDVIKTYMAVNSYAGFKWKSAYYSIDDYQWDQVGVNDVYPGTQLLVYDWRHPSFDTTDPNMHPVSQREFTLGVEKMLMENFSFTARFVQKHLRYMIEDVGVIVPGVGEVYYECNPGFGYSLHDGEGQIGNPGDPDYYHGGFFDPKYPETPKAKREYMAVNLSFDKRMSNNWLAGFSYTWSRLSGNTSGLAASDEYGRVSPYVERMFDNWAMAVTKDLEYIDGPLMTDRPHQFKFYGAYSFPFHLTVGTLIQAMSGTPVTETWTILSTYWYPFNRGYIREGESGTDLYTKRTPFIWFMNAYAEYNWRLGEKFTLNLNVNVDNVFNVKTAQRLYNYRTRIGLSVDEDTVLGGNWDITGGQYLYEQDPRWLMKTNFYGPISVRFGARLSF